MQLGTANLYLHISHDISLHLTISRDISRRLFTGLSTALCATTGKYVGRGTPRIALSLIRISLLLALLLAGATAAMLYLGRDALASLFESDATVRRRLTHPDH